MRIGTWNLEGKWSSEHLALLRAQECDVWLLTEIHTQASIPGMAAHRTASPMGPMKTWAGIFSIVDVIAQPDPHPATAMAHCDGLRLMSSVLPWRSCREPWKGSTISEKTRATLSSLRKHIDEATVWGGDWNQALEGPEYVGSSDGRREILNLLGTSQLSVPTSALGSATRGHRSIDHIAVPIAWDVAAVHRVEAAIEGHRLSDHDAYMVTIER